MVVQWGRVYSLLGGDTRHGRAALAVFLAVLALETMLLVNNDLVRLGEDVSLAAVLGPGGGRWRPATAGNSAAAFLHPKVALLFLTRGEMPFEQLWLHFFQRLLSAGAASAAEQSAWQQFFSVYIHPPPGYRYPARSLFAGTEVAGRVNVTWGGHSVVEAERALIRAALADEGNEVLVLLSESCVPLWPAAQVYLQLMSERRSRVNACRNASNPDDGNQRMDYRWQPSMAGAGVTKQAWRKSSQWFSLSRRHAEVVAGDTAVNDVFARECWVSEWRFCVSDEHYIPTLLAVKELENETACTGVLTHTHWDGPYLHPKTFGAEDASPATLEGLRAGCRREQLDARQELRRLMPAAWAGNWSAALAARQLPLLALRCPLFARKMDSKAVEGWSKLLQPEL